MEKSSNRMNFKDFQESKTGTFKRLEKASVLSASDDPKKQDRARARQVEVDYKDLLRQIKARKKGKVQKESFEIDKSAHRKAQREKKIRDRTKTGDEGSKIAQTKVKGPKLYGEGKTFDAWKKAAASALGRKKEEKKAEKAMDAGARAKRKLQRKEYASKVSGSEDNVPDEMRD